MTTVNNSATLENDETATASLPEPHPARLTKTTLDNIAATLTDRDHALITLLTQHRYASTHHIATIDEHHHTDHDAAVRLALLNLNHLRRLGLVDHLDRRIGGGLKGSTTHIWRLTEPGYRLATGTNTRRRYAHPSTAFLAHTLTITEIRARIEQHTHTTTNLTMTQVETEPACWRTWPGPNGQPCWVKPDLAVTIEDAQYEHHYWIEADLGTERPTRIRTKIRAYLDHYLTGTEQHTRGIYPHILIITTNQARITSLTAALTTIPDLPAGMITLSTLDNLINTITTHLAA